MGATAQTAVAAGGERAADRHEHGRTSEAEHDGTLPGCAEVNVPLGRKPKSAESTRPRPAGRLATSSISRQPVPLQRRAGTCRADVLPYSAVHTKLRVSPHHLWCPAEPLLTQARAPGREPGATAISRNFDHNEGLQRRLLREGRPRAGELCQRRSVQPVATVSCTFCSAGGSRPRPNARSRRTTRSPDERPAV